MRKKFAALLFAFAFAFICHPATVNAKPITFIVPPWAGGMVKAQIAMQVLEAIGFPTAMTTEEPEKAYRSLENGDADVFMSAWLPLHKLMLLPLLEEKVVHIAGVNVANARTGLCIPDYVDPKVKSIADLAPNAEKFGSVIYNLEAGSGLYNIVDQLILDDFEGLGSWKQQGEPIDALFKQVLKSFKEKQWIVFGCWQPHWTNVTLDMRYLDGVKGSGILIAENSINTVIRPKIKKQYPDPYLFLSRINVDKKTQGKWTYDVAIKEQTPEETATEWIKGHLDVVRQWVGNIKAANGQRAADVLETKF
ncbi:glycine betaine ABC transporter substrate-binding protein [Halodesulfovibrio sp.]|jgi:glycine betaine/proline transport system substrate-binding protein|uniref:glycine betaine ABC transporter substrate-binding protein n=1 Tax=Halodesulfovibrio sp. TaxID=1912772 RepID=UPI0025D1D5A9|nr:glycine betaine ABC transporter substrate-binding protein [Halodesulfovibrio sp.]MCT4535505.1 glycine/betaine ABC transporter substrate-binding protein [Halodesulfovibrio sp.]MCT4626319.1 glycine/betaine ABC transporter substrate-binding protein [Halodesulfovibrio sp.]